MSIVGDIRKTISYAGRNGLRETWYAAGERIREKAADSYTYEAPDRGELESQQEQWAALEKAGTGAPLISFLVPCYEPDIRYLKEMIASVLDQTWQNYELVIADATRGEEAEQAVRSFHSEKISYHRIPKNEGISGNTNLAASFASGDYVALLDYDDLLTGDCVFCVTRAILDTRAEILYSDEDKCGPDGRNFFEPNRKPDFNPDYFLANNYICHLLVMKRELFLALKLRSEYDGAQDYDLILRAPWSGIRHIPRVLYHWRTHAGSTAGDPASKDYAYEAGLRALQEHFRVCHIDAVVEHARHRGFYKITYRPDIFTAREDIGVVGGKLVDRKKRIVGGAMDGEGNVLFRGLRETDSGPMHRADTMQDVPCVDARCMEIREELQSLYRTVFPASYVEDDAAHPEGDILKRSVEFCRAAGERGYLILFDPGMVKRV